MTDLPTRTTVSSPTVRRDGIELLPAAWKRAFLWGPWILLTGGALLVAAAFISGNRESFGTTCLTLGVAVVVGGALLPRASGKFSVAGAEANVYGVSDALKGVAEIANATVPDSDPAKEEKVKSYVSTAAELLSSQSAGYSQPITSTPHTPVATEVREPNVIADSSVSFTKLILDVFTPSTGPKE